MHDPFCWEKIDVGHYWDLTGLIIAQKVQPKNTFDSTSNEQ